MFTRKGRIQIQPINSTRNRIDGVDIYRKEIIFFVTVSGFFCKNVINY